MVSTGWAAAAAVALSSCALVVAVLSYRNARRVGREAGWWIQLDRDVWFAEDPEILAAWIRNPGRTEARVVHADVRFFGRRRTRWAWMLSRRVRRLLHIRGPAFRNHPWYWLDVVPLVVAPGDSQLATLSHTARGKDRESVIPEYDTWGWMTVELGSGEEVTRWVRLFGY